MKTLAFNVELLSDIVLTANAATTGGHEGVDYLRGSVFLGAAAAIAARELNGFPADLLLSGRVRFLDACPRLDGMRTIPVPLSFHKIKGEEWKGKKPFTPAGTEMPSNGQPKQWRGGYMTLSGQIVEISKVFRIKSEVNRATRRSADGQLFGYQAIPAGTLYTMFVQADREEDAKTVVKWFDNQTIYVGRSRCAEYGRIGVNQNDAGDIDFSVEEAGDRVILYLAADLALVRDGAPVLLPKPEDFGLPSDFRLLPDYTFVRSRSYAPWNSFFNTRMQERQVLVKGGVIAFKTPQPFSKVDLQALQNCLVCGIGLYREEGLGQVWVNPSFLLNPPELCEAPSLSTAIDVAPSPGTPLTTYLVARAQRRHDFVEAFKKGLLWAKEWNQLQKELADEHQAVPSKSQWANVREMAMRGQHDLVALTRSLDELARDLRRKVWVEATIRRGGDDKCLLGAIRSKQADPLFAMALYHACVEMGRKQSVNRR